MDNLKDSVVHTIHVSGTVDMFMDELIVEKQNIIDGFEGTHDSLERIRSALTSDDLL
jgi:hypothetical protein